MTAAELWQMAAGKRREDRLRAYEQAGVIWTLATSALSEREVAEFIRCGALSVKQERMPYSAEVERKVAEIRANGGRVLFPEPETP